MPIRQLAILDWSIVAIYVIAALIAGVVLTRRASRSVEDFFISGRKLPWWLIGTSMAATNFSIDTPIAIAGLVAKSGIAGVWFFWSSGISAMLAACFFAQLWRRAEVITDAELIELRYGGKPAAALRLFKGVYFGVIVNCFVMGWVMTAMLKVMSEVSSLDRLTILVGFVLIALVYTLLSGFWGVVVTDLFQYAVALGGSIAVAYYSVREAGGLSALASQAELTRLMPPLSSHSDANTGMPFSVFLTYIGLQWWAHKYADGGGKTIQRMSAARDEKQAVYGTLWFAIANYALQVWPWILTALASGIVLGALPDPESAYPKMMLAVVPHGLLGLALVALIGAFMSTIDTHLNLGSSYLVNDIYRRFCVRSADESHYVLISRLGMLLLLAIASIIGWRIDSVGDAWKFILAFSAGAGPTYILRWFWWRANAWTELSAMIASGIVASVLQWHSPELLYSWRLLLVVGISAAIWLPVTLLTTPVDVDLLLKFVGQVRPGRLGWSRILKDGDPNFAQEMEPFFARAMTRWAVGIVLLFSLCFAIGKALLGQGTQSAALFCIALISLTWLLRAFRSDANQSPEG